MQCSESLRIKCERRAEMYRGDGALNLACVRPWGQCTVLPPQGNQSVVDGNNIWRLESGLPPSC